MYADTIGVEEMAGMNKCQKEKSLYYIKKQNTTGGVAQATKYLLCKYKVLSSNPSLTKTEKKKIGHKKQNILQMRKSRQKGKAACLIVTFVE
jgi:hypothetical protein